MSHFRTRLGSSGLLAFSGINHVFPFFIAPSTLPLLHSKDILLEDIPQI
jgi:hypothetical protein